MAQRQFNQPAVSAHHCRSPSGQDVPPPRLQLLSSAVELGVEADDVTFESEEERQLWQELEQEFRAFVAKMGPVWIAD